MICYHNIHIHLDIIRVNDCLKHLNPNKNMNTRGKEAGVAQRDSDITVTTFLQQLKSTTNAISTTRPVARFMYNPNCSQTPRNQMGCETSYTSFILTSSPDSMEIPIQQNELIKITKPTESSAFTKISRTILHPYLLVLGLELYFPWIVQRSIW